ncbi:hypothetical protein [Serratia sp. Se-RSBMAAmG]|uniref:hypothetical protein n=1 Tax=Serratia sp. Se-RSBMAAmG TaxID=3043305 RepID=UPI0024AEFE23|nr:hypothetical protein [Serratia sp. Se-RSBMAAmG]MDI6975924.1 hypothetical protein [Serratia sp. Se-RSBMAAmG]
MNWFWIVVKNMHRGVILVPLYLTERVCYHVGEGLVSFSSGVEKLRKSLQVKLPIYGKEFIEAEDRKERQKAETQLKSQEWDE